VNEILERALAGVIPSRTEAYALARARGTLLAELLATASALRDRGWGATVTYSRKVFIPLTNLCRDHCRYCTFAQAPNSPTARTLTPDEVLTIARAGAAAGCKEALFSLGEKPEEVYDRARRELHVLGYETTTEYLAAMCRLVFEETGLMPHSNCGVLDPWELELLRPWNVSMGLMLENISPRLLGPGLAHAGSPGKDPAVRIKTIEDAGRLGIPFTTGILIGIGETLDERTDSLFAIRELQARSGNVQEVIIQNFRAKDDTPMRGEDEPSALDMARTIAVARLVLGPEMSIQAPPNLSPDAYGFYLLAGINDWGGVSPVTADHINPEAPWPKIDELREITEDAGFALRERLAVYPRFQRDPATIREPFATRVAGLVDESGYVKPGLEGAVSATPAKAARPFRRAGVAPLILHDPFAAAGVPNAEYHDPFTASRTRPGAQP
jgi:7,8-didemethyl-8-hydroxy-5-deazariboflavin synthase CofG subunit